jgi:hypothetical protein
MPDQDHTPSPSPGPHVGRAANGQFTHGWTGRPPGSKNKRHQSVLDLLDQYDFDPLEAKIALCRDLQQQLATQAGASPYETLELQKLYASCLADLTPYCYPKLKAVEHSGQLEILAKLQALDQCTDEELRMLLDEAEAMMRRLPNT